MTDHDLDLDRKPVPSKPEQLDLLPLASPRRRLDPEAPALPSTRSSHRAPGLTAESMAAAGRHFAAVRADHRRAERSRRRTWRRLT